MVHVSFIFTCIAYDCQVWPLTWCNPKEPVTRGGFPLVIMPCTELVLSLLVCFGFFCYVIWVCWIPPVCLEIHVEFYWQCGSVCKTTLSCLPLLMNAVGYILLPHLYTCIFFLFGWCWNWTKKGMFVLSKVTQCLDWVLGVGFIIYSPQCAIWCVIIININYWVKDSLLIYFPCLNLRK